MELEGFTQSYSYASSLSSTSGDNRGRAFVEEVRVVEQERLKADDSPKAVEAIDSSNSSSSQEEGKGVYFDALA